MVVTHRAELLSAWVRRNLMHRSGSVRRFDPGTRRAAFWAAVLAAQPRSGDRARAHGVYVKRYSPWIAQIRASSHPSASYSAKSPSEAGGNKRLRPGHEVEVVVAVGKLEDRPACFPVRAKEHDILPGGCHPPEVMDDDLRIADVRRCEDQVALEPLDDRPVSGFVAVLAGSSPCFAGPRIILLALHGVVGFGSVRFSVTPVDDGR